MTAIDIRIPAEEVDTTRWEYIVSDEAWYAEANEITLPHVTVSRAHTGGGGYWEFSIEQVSNIGLKLGIFDETRCAFAQRPDLFAALAELGRDATMDDVRETLDALGFIDRTERVLPERYQPTEETPVTIQPTDTRPGLNTAHLPFLARLIDVAEQAGVTVVYCCFNADWGIMTRPELDDQAGAAFLKALGVGDVGEPEQRDPDGGRTILAGRSLQGGVRLWVRPIPTDEATEDAP